MKSLLVGIVAVLLGVVGLMSWWYEFLQVLKGDMSIGLVICGPLIAYLGIENMKPDSTSKERPKEESKEERKKDGKADMP